MADATYDDVSRIQDLTSDSLVALLRDRFEKRRTIYTWAGGQGMLLSMNPFCTIEGLVDDPRSQQLGWADTPTDALPPHIFALAERAWRQLKSEANSSQAFVVNGESGAGKTEACRQLMRYIAEASARGESDPDAPPPRTQRPGQWSEKLSPAGA